MLAKSNKGVPVQSVQLTELAEWNADGIRYLIGFNGTGSWSAEFRLYVENIAVDWWEENFPGQPYDPSDPWYVQSIHPSMRNAYVSDRGVLLPEGAKVLLKVFHEAPSEQIYKGTILGG